MGLSKELIERFKKVDPATMGHYIGGGFLKPQIKPLNIGEGRMVGPAYTVRLSGRDSCGIYYAISKAPKGSVIVVDRCGDETFACCGEMVATYAQGRGMAGMVIDGPATDSVAISKLDIPIFCTGISSVTTVILGVSGEVQIPITCGGAIVNPGDIVFGDADGVVVLPPDNYEEALEKSEQSVRDEITQREIFARGELPGWDIDRLFETDTVSMLLELRKKD
ncbi:MAG: RraA family protein [Eubacterium sp.]|jgi:4-hydroxy-4-methyl-2-oxoglutarate aldolase